ncbi:MAG: hypothetical protein ACNA7J_06245 [Wenzhouxiangella sp.]
MIVLNWIRASGLVLLVLALTTAPATADSPEPDFRITPYQCEDWQSLIDELVQSDDSLDNEIGRLYAEPGMRFCEARQVRVTSDFNLNWDFFDLPNWSFLAWVLRALAITALLGLCAWLAWRWRGFATRMTKTNHLPRSASVTSERAQLDDEAGLPDDIPAAALAAWQQNRPRLAMSLLYRGATMALLPDAHQSRTEREVMQALKGNKTSLADLGYMTRLIDHWLRVAWADQPPTQAEFDLLCRQWSHHCRGTGGAQQ